MISFWSISYSNSLFFKSKFEVIYLCRLHTLIKKHPIQVLNINLLLKLIYTKLHHLFTLLIFSDEALLSYWSFSMIFVVWNRNDSSHSCHFWVKAIFTFLISFELLLPIYCRFSYEDSTSISLIRVSISLSRLDHIWERIYNKWLKYLFLHCVASTWNPRVSDSCLAMRVQLKIFKS